MASSATDAPKPNAVETVSKGGASHQNANESQPVLPSKSDIPPPVINSAKTEKDKEYRLNRKRFYVEILTLIAVIVYAWVAYRQWEEIRKSTDAATPSLPI